MSQIEIKESRALEEVWEARRQLYERWKHLNGRELVDKVNQEAEELMKKYQLDFSTKSSDSKVPE